jgi:hypothetical protein
LLFNRARIIGVYRFWRDTGFAIGALVAGIGADLTSPATAIIIVATLTATSGLIVATTRWHTQTPTTPADRDRRPMTTA